MARVNVKEPYKVFIGWDSREVEAYKVCQHSIEKNTTAAVNIVALEQDVLRKSGVYKRRDKDVSTEFAFTRFLVPYLSNYKGWALFCDCDMLFTKDLSELFSFADDKYAVMVCKHDYVPSRKSKMDGQPQTNYPRKNWSSVMLFNCGHPYNDQLRPNLINGKPGKFLHRFKWLSDRDIGSLPLEWNWLEGEYEKPEVGLPANIHYTYGGPWFDDWQDVDYADLWRTYHDEVVELERGEQIRFEEILDANHGNFTSDHIWDEDNETY